ncbi:ABC transporter ATP-binding protein [Pedococcus sp.]|jgi:ABC-type lipoprotein export system ATPase subunit|uniref:ABC transporter ATP-binding protein n=1 Tax=Pedococcus sp. TaxID=2860345 RepID=UPI002E1070B6|nr:ABC transporter ATP-binding protein [Pedococcus sp.]
MALIEMSMVTKSFTARESRVDVLKGVTFEVDRGEIAWISGPSGCGKTTLLNVLGLLATADSGSYRLSDAELLALSSRRRTELRRTVFSTVFQTGNLFAHLTALENVLVGMPPGTVRRAREALRGAHLGSLANRRAGAMSGGEQQRVSIARALARQSEVILADEPTSSLDEQNAMSVLSMLREASKAGATVLIASHDARAASIATRRLELVDGVVR